MSIAFARRSVIRGLFAATLLAASSVAATSQTPEPIKVGFGIALTGNLAANGKAALLAINMWADKVNAGGGLLGRPIKLVYYDDQSNPGTIPGIYTKLIDVDKIDLVVSPYGTNLIAPALPVVMQKQRTIMGLFGVGVNEHFKYDRYFQIMPLGPNSGDAIAEAFFSVSNELSPKPKTVAILAADAEFGQVNAEAARKIAKRHGIKVVYDRSYPPSAVDFSSMVRAVRAAEPEIVFLASYPSDTVGLVRSINEVGLNARLIGGGPVGLQFAAVRMQLGPQINNLIGYEFYIPAKTLEFPGIAQFIEEYQKKATGQGVDPLGFYVPPLVYAAMEVLEQAVRKNNSLDQKALAQTLHEGTFKTIVGDIRFANNGEWEKGRVLLVQYINVTDNSLDQFRGPKSYSIVYPPEFRTSKPVTPFRP